MLMKRMLLTLIGRKPAPSFLLYLYLLFRHMFSSFIACWYFVWGLNLFHKIWGKMLNTSTDPSQPVMTYWLILIFEFVVCSEGCVSSHKENRKSMSSIIFCPRSLKMHIHYCTKKMDICLGQSVYYSVYILCVVKKMTRVRKRKGWSIVLTPCEENIEKPPRLKISKTGTK